MARVAIVKASTLAKHVRLDARFYLGPGKEQEDEIAAARKRAEAAVAKLDRLIAEVKADQERVDAMLREQEVLFLEGSDHGPGGGDRPAQQDQGGRAL